eukprot:275445_1
MSTVPISKNKQNAIPSRRLVISRRTSSKSLDINDKVNKKQKHNQLANNDKKLIDDIKEIEETEEIKTLKQKNNTLQNTINNAKLILSDEKTANSSKISLKHLLQKHNQKMQQIITENEELKTNLCKHENEHSEKILHLTQQNEDIISTYDKKLKHLISAKDKITAELNDSNAFTLLIRQEHHSQLQEIKKKLHSMEQKYKTAIKSETSYKAKIQQMEREKQTQSRQSIDISAIIEKVPYFDIDVDNEMLSMKERSFDDLKVSISYSELYMSERAKSVKWNDNYNGMKYVLRQYYMTRIIVFGIGMWILPTNMIASVSLGTANGFNWMYAYKYGCKKDLMKQSVLFGVEVLAAKYLNDIKHIGCGIAMHGLFDLFNVYQLYKHERCMNRSIGIIKEVGISAMLNVVSGVGTMLLSPKAT